jgi:hypothetical protein
MKVEDNGVEPMTSCMPWTLLNREQFIEMLVNAVFYRLRRLSRQASIDIILSR